MAESRKRNESGTLIGTRLSDSSSGSGLSVRRRPSELPPRLPGRAGGGHAVECSAVRCWRRGPGSTVASLQRRRWVRACLGPRVALAEPAGPSGLPLRKAWDLPITTGHTPPSQDATQPNSCQKKFRRFLHMKFMQGV
eukprot:s1751_g12.t1